MPGPVAQISRLHGQYAVATVSSVTLLLRSWEVRYETKTVDVTAHGDDWEQMIVTTSSWRFRATCLAVPNTTTTLLSGLWNSTQPGLVTVSGYSGSVGGGNLVFSGTGYATSGTFSSPEGMVEQEIEITGTGVPTAGI